MTNRNEVLVIRFSVKEKAMVKALSEAAGLQMSSWARSLIFREALCNLTKKNKTLPVRYICTDCHEIYIEPMPTMCTKCCCREFEQIKEDKDNE